MAKITFLAVKGCMFSSISSLIDALSIANRWHQYLDPASTTPLFETEIVTLNGNSVCANGNIEIQANRAMAAVNDTDLILVPAFMQPNDVWCPENILVLEWLRTQYASDRPIAATCTGAFMLAESGLLDGKIATTNWQFAKMFQRRYPEVQLRMDRMLTEDRGLICTGASTAVFNLGLHLIRRFGSDALAAACGKAFLVDPNRDSQAPYVVFHSYKNHGDPEIREAQDWMESHFERNVPIDAIAQKVGLSPRHFKRRFRKATGESPLAYLQQVRIEAAKKQLETTQESMSEITYRIGYEDSSTFRRLFKKQTGISPREYRDKFCRLQVA